VSPLSSFGVPDGLDAGVKAVYLDRGFYDSKCLTLLQAHNYAYVILIIRWGGGDSARALGRMESRHSA